MSNVKRIYPEAKSALINWIEENFDEIDEYVAIFSLKDGTTMAVYDCYTYIGAVGLAEVAKDTIHAASHEGEFIPKQRK